MNGLSDVSIIMPVFNEKNTLENVLAKIVSLKPKEIIIVDDGSLDGTVDILRNLKYDKSLVKVYFHENNQGKGAAIITALGHVTGGIVTIQDADLEYDPEELFKLVKPIQEKKADVVYGSRFLEDDKRIIYIRYRLGNWFLSALISLLFLRRITDSYTCYKVFRTDVIKGIKLNSKRFEIEAEFTVKLLKKGVKILELPISYNPRRLEEGKKIGWMDGVKGVLTVLRYRI